MKAKTRRTAAEQDPSRQSVVTPYWLLNWIAFALPRLWETASRPGVWSVSAVLLFAGKLSGAAPWVSWWAVVLVFLAPGITAACLHMAAACGPIAISLLEVYLERRLERERRESRGGDLS